MVVKNPESIEFENVWTLESKEEFLEELEINRIAYGWDDSEEEVESNIKLIESILLE